MSTERNRRINLYVSDSENEMLCKKFGIDPDSMGMGDRRKLASCIRDAALGIKVKIPPQVDPIAVEQFRELSRLASNLNQIMHSVNSSDLELGSMAGEVSDILKEVRRNLLNQI